MLIISWLSEVKSGTKVASLFSKRNMGKPSVGLNEPIPLIFLAANAIRT